MVKKIALVFCAAAILFGAALFIVHISEPRQSALSDGYKHETITFSGQMLDVQIADTPALQELGLGKRASLAKGKGMLFVFPDDAQHFFWMKDMEFSIDMIWLSSDLRVIYIQPDVSPQTYPQALGPSQGSRYVLEVLANFAKAHDVSIGSQMTISQ